jgi:hypothetical protein
VRSRTVSILLLAILGVLVVVAVNSAGQTPPPASGTWEIWDDTSFADTSVYAPDSIIVHFGGTLTLVNVDLTIDGGAPEIKVNIGGRLNMDGGSLTYQSTFPPRMTLVSNCSLKGVDIDPVYGILINEFGVEVSNCTFGGVNPYYGIFITPRLGGPALDPVVIADNAFNNLQRNPISASIGSFPGSTVALIVVGNVVNGVPNSDAINITLTSPSARVTVSHNTVSSGGWDGIHLGLTCDDLYLRLNGNTVTDMNGHGVALYLDAKTMDFPGIVDLSVDTVGLDGLNIKATGEPIDGLVIVNHTNVDAGRTAVSLQWAYTVTLTDSHIDTAATDFLVAHGTLDIYQSVVQRGSATVTHDDSWITSWKWLEMRCQWQNGIPVPDQRVEVLGPVDRSVLSGNTDRNGWWGNETYSDWHMTATSNVIAMTLTPVLVNPKGNITANVIPTLTSSSATVTFNDTTGPTLVVTDPAGDVVQNTTAITISGSSTDDHSGVALVQFSFDPNPDWDVKIWSDATGTTKWHVTLCTREPSTRRARQGA